jgi:hypothetical protein
VAREEWYVDLQILPHQATDPFVRLGLVRYQANAPKHLQVSQPIVEWTQILPKRHAVVTVADTGGALAIVATVTGQATVGVKPEKWAAAQGTQKDLQAPELEHARPIMHFRLIAEGRDSAGRMTQFVVGDREARTQPPPSSSGTDAVPADGGATWTAQFDVSAADRNALGNVKFFVFMEEIEYRHPATYQTEPLELAKGVADTTFVASGPRFSARVDLDNLAAPVSEEVIPA